MKAPLSLDAETTALTPGIDLSVQVNPLCVLSDVGMASYLTASSVRMITQGMVMGATATVSLSQDGLITRPDIIFTI